MLTGRDFDLRKSLGEVLARRRSCRSFAPAPLALETLGRLLHASYGVAGLRDIDGECTYARPSPSAGGLYPLEFYVATQRIVGLADGMYHYDARAHELELRCRGEFHARLAEATIGQDMIRDANLVVVLAGWLDRTFWKYGQRGYRYVWLDAGHAAQNLYLVATALGLGVVSIGGFFDAEIDALAALPREESTMYLVCVGQPSSSPSNAEPSGARSGPPAR